MKNALFGWAAVLTLLAAGCEHDETVTLAGEVHYDAYESGVIVLTACESESSSRAGLGVSLSHPGDCVAEKVLDAPGPFSFKATVSWADTEPDIDLLIYLLEDEETKLHRCIAGSRKILSVANHRNLDIVLEANNCPVRE